VNVAVAQFATNSTPSVRSGMMLMRDGEAVASRDGGPLRGHVGVSVPRL
jgi:hypothetical protein